MRIAILIPTYFRPAGLRRLLQSLRNTAPEIYPVVVAEPGDEQASVIANSFGAIFAYCPPPHKSGPKWNFALSIASNFDAYILGSDDTYYLPGWYEEMVKSLEENDNSGLFALNDGTSCQHYLMTRDFMVEHHGGVMAVPHYSGWSLDIEAVERASRVGKYFFVEKARLVHDWHGSATRIKCNRDKAIFEARKAVGFPDDFESIIEMEFPA